MNGLLMISSRNSGYRHHVVSRASRAARPSEVLMLTIPVPPLSGYDDATLAPLLHATASCAFDPCSVGPRVSAATSPEKSEGSAKESKS